MALPSIQRELGLAAPTVQWVVTAYAITFGGLLILGGRAADVFGTRRLLMLTAAAAAAGFLLLMHLPATGGYSPLLSAVMLVGFGTAGDRVRLHGDRQPRRGRQ